MDQDVEEQADEAHGGQDVGEDDLDGVKVDDRSLRLLLLITDHEDLLSLQICHLVVLLMVDVLAPDVHDGPVVLLHHVPGVQDPLPGAAAAVLAGPEALSLPPDTVAPVVLIPGPTAKAVAAPVHLIDNNDKMIIMIMMTIALMITLMMMIIVMR